MSRPYEVIVHSDVTATMRDGVSLACDVYLPAKDGVPALERVPTILERTPYGKDRADLVATARAFAAAGYAHVLQDCRGRGGSEGRHHRSYEPDDGYDSVEWVAAQPWCDGRVATVGLSYGGVAQGSIGAMNPPHLAAMVPAQGFSFMQRVRTRFGGAYSLSPVVRQFRMALTSPAAQRDPTVAAAAQHALDNMHDWMRRLPFRPGHSPWANVPGYEAPIIEYAVHHDFDPYWRHPAYDVSDYWDRYTEADVQLIGGWYDSHTESILEAFDHLRRRERGSVRVIMGPWKHGGSHLERSYAGDAEFGVDAALDYDGFRLGFFDAALRGAEPGSATPVRIFVMGGGSGRRTADGRLDHGGSWRDEPTWPLERAVPTAWYLHAGGGLAPEAPQHERSATSYRFDPSDPVPTIGGPVSAAEELIPAGGFDQRGAPEVYGARDTLPLAARHDVCVFQSEPLEHDVEVTGALEVTLFVSSDCVDTDFTVKLIDVYPPNPDYPNGYALNIQDGILRMRYRDRQPEERLMEPGEVYEVRVPIFATSNRFQAGHRIRLDVSSSNFPRFDVNPNTGDPLWQERHWKVATNTVHHDSARPSRIVLPIVPIEAAS